MTVYCMVPNNQHTDTTFISCNHVSLGSYIA